MNTPLRPLSDVLQASAADLATLGPPPERMAATVAAMRKAQAQRHSTPRRWWQLLSGMRPLAWSGAATCATLLLGATLLLSLEPVPADLEASDSGFVPLVSGERWVSYLHEGTGTAWVVSSELPRERLALLGLPYDPSQAGERVRAELLMHASGDVLAVRLVR